MNKQQFGRVNAINQTRATLELAIKHNRTIDFDQLLIEIQATYGVSKRTAKEYVEVAKSQYELQHT